MTAAANKKEVSLIPKLRFKEFERGWSKVKIQNLINDKAIIGHLDGNHGELYPRSEEFTSSGVPYVSANDFINGEVNLHGCKFLPFERAEKFKKGIAKDGDVLFAHNATVGPTAILKTKLEYIILSTTATYYRCDNEQLMNEYLRSYFNTVFFIKQYSRVMSQSTRNQVPISMQRTFLIGLPTLPEQQKIASFLTAVDEKIQQLTRKKTLLEQYKKGVMQQLFAQETEGSRTHSKTDKNSEQIRFKNDEGNDYPDWEEKRFEEIIIKNRLGGNYTNTEEVTDFPLIKMGNLGRGKISLKKLEYITPEENIDSKDKIEYGDLFFNTRNTLDLVGKVSIWRDELPVAYYNSNLMFLKFDNNFFMNYRLNSYEGVKGLKRFATGTTSVAAIYTKDLLKLKLNTPSLPEQQKIATYLSSLDQKIESVHHQITHTQTFKKGLLQGMFV